MKTGNLAEKPAMFDSQRAPHIVARDDGDAMTGGEDRRRTSPFHRHDDTEDPLRPEGEMTMDRDDGAILPAPDGPRVVRGGLRHGPRAGTGAHALTIEPGGPPIAGSPAIAAPKPRI